jgi:hypothetical protein
MTDPLDRLPPLVALTLLLTWLAGIVAGHQYWEMMP